MSDDIPGWEKPGKKGPEGEGPKMERVVHNPQSVRVPEKVSRGVFASGMAVWSGQNEFVMDFYQSIAKPPQVVARVVMPLSALEGLLNMLKGRMAEFSKNCGAPAPIPKMPNERPMTMQEFYDELKIPEDLAAGSYATGLLVNFTPLEFHIDFVTGFYPNASVSSRIYLVAPRVQAMIDALTNTHVNLVKQRLSQQPPQTGQGPPDLPGNPLLNRPEGPKV